MSNHPLYATLQEQLVEGRLERREFVRYAALLGVSASAAYAFAGKITGEDFAPVARADSMPMGGKLRLAMRCTVIKIRPRSAGSSTPTSCARSAATCPGPATTTSPVPISLESWAASDDLKTWTLNVRKGVKWHNGRDFTAEDVAWNLHHVLNPDTGSSVLGLMKGYMMNDDGTGLWDANAIEIVDDRTVRLNTKDAAGRGAGAPVPLSAADPRSDGRRRLRRRFERHRRLQAGRSTTSARSRCWRRADDYWGDGPYLDQLEFLDLGDDPSAASAPWRRGRSHGIVRGRYRASRRLQGHAARDHLPRQHGADRGGPRPGRPEPFDDARVRKAMRWPSTRQRSWSWRIAAWVRPASTTTSRRSIPSTPSCRPWSATSSGAKQLLADAGHPDGIDVEIACKKDPAWELLAVQAMVEQWADANIRVNINVMPSAQFWEVWDKVPFGYTFWTHRPLGFMVLGLAYRSGVPWNESHYANPDFDAKLTTAEGTLDVEERRKIMVELETDHAGRRPDHAACVACASTAAYDKVKGYGMHPTSYIFLENLALAT